jgi:hypothetical protein
MGGIGQVAQQQLCASYVRFVVSGMNDFRGLDCQETPKTRFDAQ